MNKLIQKYGALFKEMFLYGIIGVTSAGIDTLLFHLLTSKFGVYSLYANIFSVIVGICISFTLNLFFNFKTKDHIARRFASFFMIGMFGLLLSEGILALGEHQSWNMLLTKIASVVIVAIVQYILNKFISFRKTKQTKENENG